MLGNTRSNYYEILNVPKEASKSEIREAYIRMRNTFSGQNQALYSLFDESEAQAMLERVEEAFRALNDDYTRTKYDSQSSLVKPAPEQQAERSVRAPETNFSSQQRRVAQSTRASQARSEEMQTKLKDIIEAGDPGDGELYKQLREALGVSEKEMQERTKIGFDHIRGIETNTFDQLPKTIFVRGFLRSYFKYLGIKEPEEMVQAFADRYQNFLDNQP